MRCAAMDGATFAVIVKQSHLSDPLRSSGPETRMGQHLTC